MSAQSTSTQYRRRGLWGAAVAVLAAAAFGALSVVAVPPASSSHRPDLNPSAPYNLRPTIVEGRYQLGYASKFVNEGGYRLLIRGRGPAGGELSAQQYYDGKYQDPVVGKLYYQAVGVGQTGHNHWHFRDLMLAELRNTPSRGGGLVASSSKQGFCLGNLSTNNCNRGEPNRSEVIMGLGPGAEDTYSANIEGQYINVTDVPSGTYTLRFTVNPLRSSGIRESSYDDNVSSARVRFRKSGSDFTATIEASCSSAASCGG